MSDTLLILLIVYFAVATKVTEWMVVSALGNWLLAPHGYLKHARWYQVVRFATLLAALIVAVVANVLWYKVLICVLATWFGSIWLGRRQAFAAIRKQSQEQLAGEEQLRITDPEAFRRMTAEPEYEQSRANTEKFATISDRELSNMLKLVSRYGGV